MNGNEFVVMKLFRESFTKETKKNIKNDFKKIHLSGNLMDTVWVEDVRSPSILECEFYGTKPQKMAVIHIPAVRYDIKKYREEMVIEHHPEWGSYAQEVDVMGGFSHKHVGYVERAIYKALSTSIRSTKIIAGKVGLKVTTGSIEEK